MDEHREEREELAAIQAEIWEPDRDDHERELMMDALFAEHAASGLLWVMRR